MYTSAMIVCVHFKSGLTTHFCMDISGFNFPFSGKKMVKKDFLLASHAFIRSVCHLCIPAVRFTAYVTLFFIYALPVPLRK